MMESLHHIVNIDGEPVAENDGEPVVHAVASCVVGMIRGIILDILPLPKPLPNHGGNRQVPAHQWGMTMRKWVEFLEACKQTTEWGKPSTSAPI